MQLGLPVILFLLFLVLKLTEVINWSWVWVTSPLWISAAIGFVAFGLWTILAAALSRK